MRFYLPAFLAIDWIPVPETPPHFWTGAGIVVQIDLVAFIVGVLLFCLATIGLAFWLLVRRVRLEPREPGELTPPEFPAPRRHGKPHLYDAVLLDDRREWELEEKRRG